MPGGTAATWAAGSHPCSQQSRATPRARLHHAQARMGERGATVLAVWPHRYSLQSRRGHIPCRCTPHAALAPADGLQVLDSSILALEIATLATSRRKSQRAIPSLGIKFWVAGSANSIGKLDLLEATPVTCGKSAGPASLLVELFSLLHRPMLRNAVLARAFAGPGPCKHGGRRPFAANATASEGAAAAGPPPTAVITGSSTGIGRATANMLADKVRTDSLFAEHAFRLASIPLHGGTHEPATHL